MFPNGSGKTGRVLLVKQCKDGGSENGFSIRSQKEWRTVFSAAVFFKEGEEGGQTVFVEIGK